MRRPVVAMAGLAVACPFLVAACGGTTSPAEAALQRHLLTVQDLPAGWSAASTSGTTVGGSCLAPPKASGRRPATATAAFVQGTASPTFSETLATSRHPKQELTAANRALARCHHAMVTLAGHRTSATVQPMTLPGLAGGESAYRWSLTISGLTFEVDQVVFGVGRYVGEVSYADVGAPLAQTVDAFAAAAVATAQGEAAPVRGVVSFASAPVRTAHTAMGAVAYQMVGHGPPLVMIMGFGGSTHTWDPRFVDALAQHFTVYAPDNAGIGGTQALPAPLSIDAMADQTSALIQTLGLKTPDVLGWSMGGMIAQALAVLHPSQVRRLVLCASFPGTGTMPPTQAAVNDLSGGEQKATSVLFPLDQHAAAAAYYTTLTRYPVGPTVARSTVSAQASAVTKWFDGNDPAGRRTTSISAPTLIADGANDQIDPIANDHRLARLLPHSKLVVYPDAAHAFLFQDAGAFLPRVEAFLGGSAAH